MSLIFYPFQQISYNRDIKMYCITEITGLVAVVDREFWQRRPNSYLILWDNIFASMKYSFQAEELMDWHIICNSRRMYFFFGMHLCKSCEHENITASRYCWNSTTHQHFIIYYGGIKALLSLWEYRNKASILQLNNVLPSSVLSNVCSQEKPQSFGWL